MKKLFALTALALLAPMASHAQTLDRWDIQSQVIRSVNNAGMTQCNTATAVSYTIPTGAMYLRFDPSQGHYHCVENTTQPVCGTARPTTTTSTTAWEYNAIARRLMEVNNGSAVKPNRLWVQNQVSADCVIWHYSAGQPNE